MNWHNRTLSQTSPGWRPLNVRADTEQMTCRSHPTLLFDQKRIASEVGSAIFRVRSLHRTAPVLKMTR